MERNLNSKAKIKCDGKFERKKWKGVIQRQSDYCQHIRSDERARKPCQGTYRRERGSDIEENRSWIWRVKPRCGPRAESSWEDLAATLSLWCLWSIYVGSSVLCAKAVMSRSVNDNPQKPDEVPPVALTATSKFYPVMWPRGGKIVICDASTVPKTYMPKSESKCQETKSYKE